jgi:hypothetical protein
MPGFGSEFRIKKGQLHQALAFDANIDWLQTWQGYLSRAAMSGY